jgi:hypothetical protein
MLERFKKWLNWKGKSSYSAVMINSMTKEEGAAIEAAEEAKAKDLGSALIEPLNPREVSEEAINVPVEAPKKVAKKKAPAKKAAKKKTPSKKEK